MDEPYDIAIIGGGINGCGLARDAAGRGFRVALVERSDLGCATSSGSTKLIHGGLRYLEQYAFGLVRKSLSERERLWKIAPHLIQPLRFILPHDAGSRPVWMLRLGLLLYDYMGGRQRLPRTQRIDLSHAPAPQPLRSGQFTTGFEYSDCAVDDTRLVVANARAAADLGADIFVRTSFCGVIDPATGDRTADRGDDRTTTAPGYWRLRLKPQGSATNTEIRARMIVNMAGPWADDVRRLVDGPDTPTNIRLVQGSHIITRALYAHPKAYIFQHTDHRVIFTIPYLDDFTLIGTTDRDYTGSRDQICISTEETDYLIEAVNRYFALPISTDDIVHSFSAVRALYDDGTSQAHQASRGYAWKVSGSTGRPLLTVYGGKLTTYRLLAEDAMRQIEKLLGARKRPWTAHTPLPGGNFDISERPALAAQIRQDYPFLGSRLAQRIFSAYGRDAWTLLGDSRKIGDLGIHFGGGLYQREVDYLKTYEWARDSEDILWRRSKIGLWLTADNAKLLQSYLNDPEHPGD